MVAKYHKVGEESAGGTGREERLIAEKDCKMKKLCRNGRQREYVGDDGKDKAQIDR